MKLKKYRFDVDTGFRQIVSIVVEAASPTDARSDAYAALRSDFGRVARIKTPTADAKVVRKMPEGCEPIKNAFTRDNEGVRHYWAWLVYRT